MARRSKEEMRIDREVDAAQRVHMSNVQFDIFDLAKISQAGRDAGRRGESVDAAVAAAVAQYRKN